MTRTIAVASTIALCLTMPGTAQQDPPQRSTGEQQGTVYRAPGGTTLRLILDESNVGSEVSLGEMTFPPNSDSGDHQHGAIEMFYVISGELNHIVNGKSQILTPGMAGYVKPPDKVRHKTGPAGAKVVVIWVPETLPSGVQTPACALAPEMLGGRSAEPRAPSAVVAPAETLP